MIIDSHAHLNHGTSFDDDRREVLDRARQAGVGAILNLATNPDDAGPTLDLARSHEPVFAAVGIHPHEAERAGDEVLEELERLAGDPKVVAWGEIGLDYHYMNAPRGVQRQAFATQLQIAARLELPVSVHARDADDDLVELLRKHAGAERGVIHCFTGDQRLADACLDLGFSLSFSGIVTFRNADPLRRVAGQVPEDRLLVETDSPYLAPAPGRGGRNEPSRVLDVARCLSKVRGVPLEDLARSTTENFRRLFPRAGGGGSAA